MPNINSILNDQIRRLSRREITANTKVIRRATAQFRRDIAAIKRQVAALTSQVTVLKKRQPAELTAAPEVLEKGRFRAMGVKAHRRKLGLSGKNYGKLVGVSELTIYSWEAGKTTPRQMQKAKWLAVRGLGRREAMQRLGLVEPKSVDAPAGRKRQKRGQFTQTAEEMIVSLLKGRKSLTTAQLNGAWRKAGRAGTAYVTLGMMVKSRKLIRARAKGVRGSMYSAR